LFAAASLVGYGVKEATVVRDLTETFFCIRAVTWSDRGSGAMSESITTGSGFARGTISGWWASSWSIPGWTVATTG
jgi:hypothetical protein